MGLLKQHYVTFKPAILLEKVYELLLFLWEQKRVVSLMQLRRYCAKKSQKQASLSQTVMFSQL